MTCLNFKYYRSRQFSLRKLRYLRHWESARYSKSSTSRACGVVVERRRWESSSPSWRGAKEKQKGVGRRKGKSLPVVGASDERWWQRWNERETCCLIGDERDERRDTITSCTRRAPSHFQTLLHEAMSSLIVHFRMCRKFLH